MRRFTETGKWRDQWFVELSADEKLVFWHFTENCNNAGFIEPHLRFVALELKISEDRVLAAIQGLKRGIFGADGWYWIRTFLRHQRNEDLNPNNNAHKQIIGLIQDQVERFGQIPEFLTFLGAHEGLFSPPGKVKVKVKVKKGGAGGKQSPEESEDFKAFYAAYPRKDSRAKAWESWQAKMPPLAECLAAIERAKARWDDPKYIPMPSTWLNQSRWKDAGTDAFIAEDAAQTPPPLPYMQQSIDRRKIDLAAWVDFMAENFPQLAEDPDMAPEKAPEATVELYFQWKEGRADQ